jgi:lysozyme
VALTPPRHLSKKGAAFIGAFEGFRSLPYNDAVGNATIGFGHLLHLGPVTAADKAKYPNGLTLDQALALLVRDAEKVAAVVYAIRPRVWRQTRFDALVSLGFNLGAGIFDPSHDIGRDLRTNRAAVADDFLEYDHAGAQRLPGLTRRRQAERKLWLTGFYG